jgi:hypothetical protein
VNQDDPGLPGQRLQEMAVADGHASFTQISVPARTGLSSAARRPLAPVQNLVLQQLMANEPNWGWQRSWAWTPGSAAWWRLVWASVLRPERLVYPRGRIVYPRGRGSYLGTYTATGSGLRKVRFSRLLNHDATRKLERSIHRHGYRSKARSGMKNPHFWAGRHVSLDR